MAAAGDIPLTVYVHVPWCVRKCPYCDFASQPLRGEVPWGAYAEAVLADLDADLAWAPETAARTVEAVFLGGGTPSLMPPDTLARLLDGIAARLRLAADVEVTLEANPGASERGALAAFRTAGASRLSLGVQSFDDRQLARLGRIHSAAEAVSAVEAARAAGFERINLDLMYALPEQAVDEALADLARAVELSPEHVSWYQLTLEPGTAFGRRPPPLPDEGTVARMEHEGRALLAAAGYGRYEVSAYARGREARCRHNLNYWRFGDYLGLGPAAHGKLTRPDGRIVRTRRIASPRRYLASRPAARVARETVAREALPLEFALGALRLAEGFTLAAFEARTGLPAAALEPALARAAALGLIEREGGRVRASARGYALLDSLLALFAPAPAAGGAAS